jgi:hypothetical protein
MGDSELKMLRMMTEQEEVRVSRANAEPEECRSMQVGRYGILHVRYTRRSRALYRLVLRWGGTGQSSRVGPDRQ